MLTVNPDELEIAFFRHQMGSREIESDQKSFEYDDQYVDQVYAAIEDNSLPYTPATSREAQSVPSKNPFLKRKAFILRLLRRRVVRRKRLRRFLRKMRSRKKWLS